MKWLYRHIETAVLAVRMLHVRTSTHRSLFSAIWVLVAQWLERLTGDQKVAGSIPVWGSETFFWVCDKAWVANSLPCLSWFIMDSKHLKTIKTSGLYPSILIFARCVETLKFVFRLLHLALVWQQAKSCLFPRTCGVIRNKQSNSNCSVSYFVSFFYLYFKVQVVNLLF